MSTSSARSTTTPLPAVGLEATLGFLLVMAGTVYKECGPVKWHGNCLYGISKPTSFGQRIAEARRLELGRTAVANSFLGRESVTQWIP